ncbi:MAG: glycosyltransferase [Bryobacteraceae bacterium]
MSEAKLDLVFIGLTITSTWGNGHATTYRALLKELRKRGHRITFLERDVPWYSENREFTELPYCEIGLYSSLEELRERYADRVRRADFVIVGSYVPDGIAVGEWVAATARNGKAFYDIDTPVTLAALLSDRCEYLSRALCHRYDLYLSFTGGPTLQYIEDQLGSPSARPLYCSVDPSLYYPEERPQRWDLAYLGTYAADRQPALNELLTCVAARHPEKRFAVAGPQYPNDIRWPENVLRIEHLPATEHREFYNSQAFTLNLTRADMRKAGYSPSVRLFEAAACGVAIMSDDWPGLPEIFTPGTEILLVRNSADVTSNMQMDRETRFRLAERARQRTLRFHTAGVRALELENYLVAALSSLRGAKRKRTGSRQPSEAAAVI